MSLRGGLAVTINVIVHAGSDDAFIAWTSDFIPDCRGFAKIMEIYNQYRWRASRHESPQSQRWSGLADDDTWQIGAPGVDARSQAYDTRRRRELDFWFGKN
jgi:hypothetical protein